MTNDNLDQRIRDWQQNLTTISRNLMDLAETETTKQIRTRLKESAHPYQGVTAERARAAFEALDSLWQDYLLLARVVEEAVELASKNGLFRNTEADVLALLDGESLKLPAVHVPLPSRDLLTEANRSDRARPSEVLLAMQAAFAVARDALVLIGESETRLAPRIAAITHEAETLTRWAVSLGDASFQIEGIVQTATVGCDPLGASMQLDQAEAALAGARGRLQQVEQARQAVRSGLDRGRADLAALRDLVQRSRAAIEETRLKIANPGAMLDPLADEALASHEAWLDTLDETFASGRWEAARVGLLRWAESCAVRLETERNVYAHNRAALDERAELRGRFQALCAKAKSYAQRGIAAEETLDRMAEETGEAMSERPFDLERARRLVAAFETALAAKSRANNPGRQEGTGR